MLLDRCMLLFLCLEFVPVLLVNMSKEGHFVELCNWKYIYGPLIWPQELSKLWPKSDLIRKKPRKRPENNHMMSHMLS